MCASTNNRCNGSARPAIATNLLTAIGERPHLSHGDYPDTKLAVLLQNPMILERCNERALRRFQFFERPKGPGFEPSLPVVTNPVSRGGTAAIPEGATVVTNGFSAALMDFFDEGYRLMLIMLKEFLWGFRGYSGMFDAVEGTVISLSAGPRAPSMCP